MNGIQENRKCEFAQNVNRHTGTNPEEEQTCLFCGKIIKTKDGVCPSAIRRKKFCSRSCSTKYTKNNVFLPGEKHWNWNGGVTIDSNGYRRIRVGKHKYRNEHIIVAEKARIAEENRKIQAEKDRIEREKKAEQERKDREEFERKAREEARIQAEKDAKEAAEKAEAERKEREAREVKAAEEKAKREAEEKARQAALRPDKEKLIDWANSCIDFCQVSEKLESQELMDIQNAASLVILGTLMDSIKQAREL